MSLTSTFSSILCIVLPTKPNSITGQILEINLASDVPPDGLYLEKVDYPDDILNNNWPLIYDAELKK